MRFALAFSILAFSMPFFDSIFAQKADTLAIWPPGEMLFSFKNRPVETVWRDTEDTTILLVKGIAEPRLLAFWPEKERANGGAILIIPGGAYTVEAFDHEGRVVAERLAAAGWAAFVLFYRLPGDAGRDAPLADAQQAVRFLRENGEQLAGRAFSKIGVLGFSAGGHLAATVAAPPPDMAARFGEIGQRAAKVDFSALIYPVISMRKGRGHDWSRQQLLGKKPSSRAEHFWSPDEVVTEKTSPAFLVHSADDAVVSCENSLRYAAALRKKGGAAAVHLFQTGGHGYGLGRKGSEAAAWPELFEKWVAQFL